MSPARDSHPDQRGVRLTPSTIGAGIVGLLLFAFVMANADTTSVHLLVTKVSAPLWVVLTVVIGLAFAVGFFFGRRRRKD